MNKHSGIFISLEGVDGSGKSSCVEVVADWFKQRGFDVVTTREPGGTKIAECIRNTTFMKVLNNHSVEETYPETKLLLLTAARHQHIKHKIIPALKEGKVVITDRFVDSARVYQTVIDGVDRELGDELHQQFNYGLEPDLVLWFDIDLETAKKRTEGKDDAHDNISDELRSDLIHGYNELYEKNSRFLRIDANVSKEKVNAVVENMLSLTYENVKPVDLYNIGYDKVGPGIHMIVATDLNGGIGKDGDMPWSLSKELSIFKKFTEGHTVIMGRNTFESIGKPLPNRKNIVITSQRQIMTSQGGLLLKFWREDENLIKASSWEEAMMIANGDDKVFVIGGGSVYRQALQWTDTIIHTVIEDTFVCDTYFPMYDRDTINESEVITDINRKTNEEIKFKVRINKLT